VPRTTLLAALAVVLLLAAAAPASAVTYYSSASATDPTLLENWWLNPNGTGPHPADFAAGDMFVVQAGHVLSAPQGWAISGPGSALWVQPGAVLTVGDGAMHRLELTGSTFQLDDGATYVHDSAAPWDSTCFKPGVTRQFDAASTVVLRAVPLLPNADVAWGNLTVDLAVDPGGDWSWEGHLTRVNGDLTVTSTGGRAMRLASADTATLILRGDLAIGGGELDLGGDSSVVTAYLSGDFTVASGTFGSSGTGVHKVVFFGGAAPRTFTHSGGALAIGNLDWGVDTETLVLASAFTLPAPRTFTVASTGTLALGAAFTNGGTLRVSGTLRLEAGGSVGAAPSYGARGRLVYAGGSVSTGPEWGPSGPGAPLYVTIAAGAGHSVTLSASRTIVAALDFSGDGTLATGADTLTLGDTCRVTGAGPGRYVHGNLARVVPTTVSAPVAFDIGDSTHYTPVRVTFGRVGTRGTLVAGTAAPAGAPAAGEPPAGSGISQSAYVDRSWTLAGGTVPVGFDSCAVTFHYVHEDVRGGAGSGGLVVARNAGGTWSLPAVSDTVGTSITATGLTDFGEFRVGEPDSVRYELTVLAEPDSGGTASGGGLYEAGTVVPVTATAAVGWRFVGWTGAVADPDSAATTVTMDSSRTVTAHFALERYELTVRAEPDSGGTASGGGLYEPSTVVPVTATAAVGWRFAGWTGAVADPDSAATTVTMDSSRTVTAHFALERYELTVLVEPDSSGTASGGGIYDFGTQVQVKAAPRMGYVFTHWTGDVSNPGSVRPWVTMDSSKTVTAHFALKQLELVVTAAGQGAVLEDPDQETHEWGSLVVLTAVAAPGWRFASWGGDTSGSDNPLTVPMYKARRITAAFAPGTVCVSQVYAGGGADSASFTHDFVELHNRGAGPIDVTGWTLQCAAAGDSVWSVTPLAGTIPAGGWFLVQGADSAAGRAPLPAPDALGSFTLLPAGGTVALVCGADTLRGACPPDVRVVDLAGYGAAGCAEGSPAPALDDTTALRRAGGGCTDIGDNALDFAPGVPAPRNAASPTRICVGWVDVAPEPVTGLALAPVAPNPARGAVRIAYALPAGSAVRLRVVDVQGRVVATLVDGIVPAGRHEAAWDGSAGGRAAGPGLYFVRLDACGRRAVRSFVLIR
jgi:hypothetical protein